MSQNTVNKAVQRLQNFQDNVGDRSYGSTINSPYTPFTEMPTSGDLKSGDSLFFTTPPGNSINHRPPSLPPTKMGMTKDII